MKFGKYLEKQVRWQQGPALLRTHMEHAAEPFRSPPLTASVPAPAPLLLMLLQSHTNCVFPTTHTTHTTPHTGS